VDHLWVVVEVYTPELDTGGQVAVLVNCTTWVATGDPACVVDEGDHPFLKHRSFMFYQRAAEVPVAEISKLTTREPVSPELLTRIRRGLRASKFTKRGLKGLVPNR